MTLLQVPSSDSTALTAQFQEALVIDVGLRGGFFSGRHEVSGTLRGGFIRLGEISQIVERAGQEALAIPAGTSDRVTPFLEVAANFRLFDQQMLLVHLAKSTLSPRLFGEFAIRRDSRFRATGVWLTSKQPDWRYVARLNVDGLVIRDKRSVPETNNTFAVSFGFEYQRGFSDSVPSGFAFVVRGDVDLLRALKGGHVDEHSSGGGNEIESNHRPV
jgi:hypothetical protein